jgi:hypothetical protein
MKYVTFIETPEYFEALTRTEKRVVEIQRQALGRKNDKTLAAELGISPSRFSKVKWTAQAKLYKYGRKEERETRA